MRLLNLGCGTKASAHPNVLNLDWSIYLRLRQYPLLRRLSAIAVNGERAQRLRDLPHNIVVHDLRTGLPYESGSVDAVYHSHLLEHLDREVAPLFLREVIRVLRPGGIHRVVVPDLEYLCRKYLDHIAECQKSTDESQLHESYIAAILEQCVRRKAYGSSKQARFRRAVENALLGDARRRGETHQWMYDYASLSTLLIRTGHTDPRRVTYSESGIPDWLHYGLDTEANGQEYKPHSLYIEARKSHLPGPEAQPCGGHEIGTSGALK